MNIPLMVKHTKKLYHLQQVESEWIKLIELIIDKNYKTMIEIGSAYGGSTWSLSHFLDKIISVDIKQMPEKMKQKISRNCDFTFIHKDSRRAMKNISRTLKDTKADMLFIDGEHTYRGVAKDFRNMKQFVKKDGIIIFHDITKSKYHIDGNCVVFRFWEKIKTEYEYMEFKYDKDWGGIGIIFL